MKQHFSDRNYDATEGPVTLTGVRHLFANWKADDLGPAIGDAVDDEWHEYFLNVLPPRMNSHEVMMLGEPVSGDSQGRTTYSTLLWVPTIGWVYVGNVAADESAFPEVVA